MEGSGLNDGNEGLPSFKPKLIERILKNVWDNIDHEANDMYEGKEEYETTNIGDVRDITKIQPDAVQMTTEYMRLFVLEALHRAQEEAMIEDSSTVEPRHIEQILAVLLLDF